MNTKLVNTTAGVILAALEQNRTAAGIALALESAQMLMTPETAAELVALRARVVELEARLKRVKETGAQLGSALVDRTLELMAAEADGVTRRVAPVQALRADDVSPQVAKLRNLLAGQRAAVEDPHDSPLHHDYRVPRELPESGGA